MFRIKICGITNIDDACAAADAGADAIGLNFYKRSKRFVEPNIARRIASVAPAGVTKVGVFVNHDRDEIVRIVDEVGLDCVQLHGDEPAEFVAALPRDVPVVRAYRCGDQGAAPLRQYIDEVCRRGRMPDAVLLDANAGSEYGGTGKLADVSYIGELRAALHNLPLILAGGLTPANVGAAIVAARPHGVDVASGVESSPGKKDAAKVRDFVAAARAAFSAL